MLFERNNLNIMKFYPRTFRELVNSIINTDKDDFKFIGTGNPAAKILIVGKEVALDPMTSESDKFHYGLYQANNILWDKCIERNQDFDDVPVWGRGNKNYIPEDFSPLYPYKGDQKIHKSVKNGGSSTTWKRYQKLLTYVYPNLLSCNEIDFHKYAFITEMSCRAFPKSPAKNPQTAQSIQTRISGLLSHEFFTQFPVVIVAAGNYVSKKMYGIDLESTFNQKFMRTEQSVTHRSEWINVHKSDDRLLLHCRQLASCSDDLLIRLSNHIKEHLKS